MLSTPITKTDSQHTKIFFTKDATPIFIFKKFFFQSLPVKALEAGLITPLIWNYYKDWVTDSVICGFLNYKKKMNNYCVQSQLVSHFLNKVVWLFREKMQLLHLEYRAVSRFFLHPSGFGNTDRHKLNRYRKQTKDSTCTLYTQTCKR